MPTPSTKKSSPFGPRWRRMHNGLDLKVNIGDTIVAAFDILVTSGSQQALEFSGKIFIDEGDVILCESPTYLGALNAFNGYGPKYIEVETDEDGMNMEAIE